jgi:hypothetical protein
MSEHDPAMIRSNFDRREKDKYYTAPWVTEALMSEQTFKDVLIPIDDQFDIWEPAAGRGDMVDVLFKHSDFIIGSDLLPDREDIEKFDFLNEGYRILDKHPVYSIITNPPYDKAEEFVRTSLAMIDAEEVGAVAMLLRSEFKHARTRRDIFGDYPFYMGELVLTKRPRWDWWYEPEPGEVRHSPRHNFSWFVWYGGWRYYDPVQLFWYEDK